MIGDIIVWLILINWIALIIYCPILKPWFGFRKPQNHPGKWFE